MKEKGLAHDVIIFGAMINGSFEEGRLH